MAMDFQIVPARSDELPPTKPAFAVDDRKAFTLGAWAGICFALALISAATVILVSAPDKPRQDAHAWAPTIAWHSTN